MDTEELKDRLEELFEAGFRSPSAVTKECHDIQGENHVVHNLFRPNITILYNAENGHTRVFNNDPVNKAHNIAAKLIPYRSPNVKAPIMFEGTLSVEEVIWMSFPAVVHPIFGIMEEYKRQGKGKD